MPRQRLLLEVSTLQEAPARVREKFGPDAEIVSAERVTVGGIRGFFAREHYEITVTIPGGPQTAPAPHMLGFSARAGIAALLDDADREEALARSAPDPEQVSTTSALFDEILGSFDFSDPVPAAVPTAPALLRRAGDMVLVIGLPEHPFAVAQSMAGFAAGAVFVAGHAVEADRLTEWQGAVRLEDRRGVLAARALGVRRGRASFVALGTDPREFGRRPEGYRDLISTVAPDQVWVVVDAGRKHGDTLAWLARIAEITPVDALAVVGTGSTATPETVEALGVPVGWIDGASVG